MFLPVAVYFPIFVLDHFCPSYFALLGPIDQQRRLDESVIPDNHMRILETFRDKGVRYLLAGSTALTLHGVPRMTTELELLVDPDREDTGIIREILVSENFGPGDAYPPGQSGDEREKSSILLIFGDKTGGQTVPAVKVPLPFGKAYERRLTIRSGSYIVDMVSLEDLILLKSTLDDPQHLADLKILQKAVKGRKAKVKTWTV